MKLKWTDHADLAIVKHCDVSRDEYLDHMTFQRNERPLFTEIFGPLLGLKEEWEEQGATPEELDFSAFRYRCPKIGRLPVATGRIGGQKPVVLQETEDFLLTRDELGRTMKLSKNAATLPLPQDWPVQTMDDWLKIKPMYQFSEASLAARLAGDWEAAAHRFLEQGATIAVSIPGGYDEPRQLMGEERLSMAYYDQPELVHDILDTIAETAVQVFERVTAVVPVDMLSVHEDMAGKSGPLAGPRQVRGFIAPYYRRAWNLLAERGARLFDQDSDGNMETVIPAFLEAGVNCMHPMEPAAGMDVVRIREQYGARLAFYGGLDKHVIRRTKDEIVAELETKLPPMIASGGCVLALDHRIPNGTPLENYCFYVDKVWEIFEREAK
jgi:hypothetical protein